MNMMVIEGYEDLKYSLEMSGEWQYDGVKSMPVKIFKLNFDFYYELDKDEFPDLDPPILNSEGMQYVICWKDNNNFSFRSDPTEGGLTLADAISKAESIVKQRIVWSERRP